MCHYHEYGKILDYKKEREDNRRMEATMEFLLYRNNNRLPSGAYTINYDTTDFSISGHHSALCEDCVEELNNIRIGQGSTPTSLYIGAENG